MKLIVARLSKFGGIDRSIAYTLLSRSWGVIAGIVSIGLVAKYLSLEEQGYYYTFSNILALQIFFELGLSYVVMQFASHEMAKLRWEGGLIVGDSEVKARLASLFQGAVKCYGVIAVLFVFIIIPGGWLFFSRYGQEGVTWSAPWLLLGVGAALAVFSSPLLSFLEGCGHVAEVAKIRFIQSILGNLITWGILISGGKLYMACGTFLAATVTGLIWFGLRYRVMIIDLWKTDSRGLSLDWKNEIWPFQWRIAVSWLSGYLIFQLFNPFLLATRGASEAGKMGMSIQAANALAGVAIAWVSTKAPLFGQYISSRDWCALDSLFKRVYLQSSVVMLVGAIGGWGVVLYLQTHGHIFGDRFLDSTSFALLLTVFFLQHSLFAAAAYLRAHKKEPLMWLSLVYAMLVPVVLVTTGRLYGARGIVLGLLLLKAAVILPWTAKIFYQCKREWHAP